MTDSARAGMAYGALGTSSIPLRIVDGRRLEKKYRDVLKPGGVLSDSAGQAHQLPRYFYEVPSWETAIQTQLSENFGLWEFIHTDVHEAEPLRSFPRYVPCAITLMALGLEQFRDPKELRLHRMLLQPFRTARTEEAAQPSVATRKS